MISKVEEVSKATNPRKKLRACPKSLKRRKGLPKRLLILSPKNPSRNPVAKLPRKNLVPRVRRIQTRASLRLNLRPSLRLNLSLRLNPKVNRRSDDLNKN